MDELTAEGMPWDLNEHLNGCLAGYQEAPSYGAAVSAGTAANGPTIAVAKLGIEGITLAAKRRHALRSASLSLSSNAVCSDVSSAKTISDEERRSWHRAISSFRHRSPALASPRPRSRCLALGPLQLQTGQLPFALRAL